MTNENENNGNENNSENTAPNETPTSPAVETPVESQNTDASNQEQSAPVPEASATQPEVPASASESVTVTFTGAKKASVTVPKGSTRDEVAKKAKVAAGSTFRSQAGAEIAGTEQFTADSTVNVVAKTRMG